MNIGDTFKFNELYLNDFYSNTNSGALFYLPKNYEQKDVINLKYLNINNLEKIKKVRERLAHLEFTYNSFSSQPEVSLHLQSQFSHLKTLKKFTLLKPAFTTSQLETSGEAIQKSQKNVVNFKEVAVTNINVMTADETKVFVAAILAICLRQSQNDTKIENDSEKENFPTPSQLNSSVLKTHFVEPTAKAPFKKIDGAKAREAARHRQKLSRQKEKLKDRQHEDLVKKNELTQQFINRKNLNWNREQFQILHEIIAKN